ncbi:unnamed protein product, partial [Symbiodinium necroappetens]
QRDAAVVSPHPPFRSSRNCRPGHLVGRYRCGHSLQGGPSPQSPYQEGSSGLQAHRRRERTLRPPRFAGCFLGRPHGAFRAAEPGHTGGRRPWRRERLHCLEEDFHERAPLSPVHPVLGGCCRWSYRGRPAIRCPVGAEFRHRVAAST